MTLKLLIPFCLCLALTACKDSSDAPEDTTNTETKSNKIITEGDIAKLKYIDFILDEKAETGIEEWHNYEQLNSIINNIKKADLTDFRDNHKVLVALIKDLKKNIPVALKQESVLARILVIETKLYKLEDVINLSSVQKEELGSTIKELLEAFSNLNFQINKKLEHDSQNIQKPA